MTPQKIVPFFAELGLLLNLVRSISSAMNKELVENFVVEDGNKNVRYLRNTSISRLQDGLKELESEIAYFFTENGTRKAADSMFDSQGIRQKFISAFKALSNEYFTFKSARTEKIAFQQNGRVNVEAVIYKLNRQHPAVVN